MCESMLGLHPIVSEIDKRKLAFLENCASLILTVWQKNIFLLRLCDLLQDGVKPFSGFLKDIYEILAKYNLLQYLHLFIEAGKFPEKKGLENYS